MESLLVAALQLEAAVHLLGLHLVVLVDQVQLAVAQCHPLLVLAVHESCRWRRALLALRLRLREVRSTPGRGAVRGRRPLVAVGIFVFGGGGRQEKVCEFVQELVGGSPLLGDGFAVAERAGSRGLGVQVGVGPAVEHAWLVLVQPQRLELGGGAADVGPHDVRWVGLVPLDAHRLNVRRWWAIGNRDVIGSSVSGASHSRRWGLSGSVAASATSPSPLGARPRVAGRFLLVVALSDLVDRVGGHSGRRLHTGDAVTRLAAGVFRESPVTLPVGGRTDQRAERPIV